MRKFSRVSAPLTSFTIALALLAGCSEPAVEQSFGPVELLEDTPTGTAEGNFIVVNNDGATLRVQAGSDQASVAIIPIGTAVSTSGRVSVVDGVAWFEIQHEQDLGWVSSAELVDSTFDVAEVLGKIEESSEQGETEEPGSIQIDLPPLIQYAPMQVMVYPGANLRDEARGIIMSQLVFGTQVTAVGEEVDEWVEVVVDETGETGWIFAQLIGPVPVAEG